MPEHLSSRSLRRGITPRLRLANATIAEGLESRVLLSVVPAPLTSVDVGTPTGGSANYNSSNQSFTIVGAGYDAFGPSDAFHYVYEPLTGDGTVTVRITSDSANNDLSLSGLNIRDSLSPTAANLFLAARDDGSVFANARLSDGITGNNVNLSEAGSFPEYLRIVRTGDIVQASYSTDGGATYQPVATETIAFSSGTVLVGMAVASSTAPTTLATATFDNFTVSPTVPITATLTSAPPATSVAPYQFTVTYNATGSGLVNPLRVGNNNWVVQLPDGSTEATTLVSTLRPNASTIVATYQLAAPTINGIYTITTSHDLAADTNGDEIVPGMIGSFQVNLPDTISGTVRSVNLASAAGVQVFIDANHDGVFESGEPTATTSATGAFSFSGLTDGTYEIAEVPPSGQQVASPSSPEQTITVANGEDGIANFINTVVSAESATIDLVSSFPAKFPATIHGGAAGSTRVRITNTGSGTATGKIAVSLVLSDTDTLAGAFATLKTFNVVLNLNTGKYVGTPVAFKYPKGLAAGTYHVFAVADSANVTAETNKLDNIVASTALVLKASGKA